MHRILLIETIHQEVGVNNQMNVSNSYRVYLIRNIKPKDMNQRSPLHRGNLPTLN